MKSASTACTLLIICIILQNSFGALDWGSWTDRADSIRDRLADIQKKTEDVKWKMLGNTEEVWAGHGSILRVQDSGEIVGSSMESSRVGAAVPETAFDFTEDLYLNTCKSVTLPKFGTIVTACGASNRCKTLTTNRSSATVCPGSITIRTSSGVVHMVRNGETASFD